MAIILGAFHGRRRATLQAIAAFLCVHLAVLVADAHDHMDRYSSPASCLPSPCGHLQDVGYPFRRRGDPPECGVPSYELSCSSGEDDGRARAPTIQINTATYLVTSINYTDSSFWVVDADLQEQSSCPVPRWDRLPYLQGLKQGPRPYGELILELSTRFGTWASFVNCSRPVTNNRFYAPVACRSTSPSSFVYVSIGSGAVVEDLEPSCGYLGMTPLADQEVLPYYDDGYAHVLAGMRTGFPVRFPYSIGWVPTTESINKCLARYFSQLLYDLHRDPVSGSSIREISIEIEVSFWMCIFPGSNANRYAPPAYSMLPAYSMFTLKWIAVLCRFVLAPLVIFVFLAYKYLKTRITIDAVEKFLRMQQMIGPTRYAYTDIIAMTSHFRDKLGQGGFGAVFKGMLLNDVHVAVKMLNCNSSCNGEDFISEVSTLGRIHHVNVVRLVGFCSEEMRRALVYEYMPRGSLDRYIFSSEKSFSWDKLNEIALGIAKGINYLHQGCDMQILHFDIKPHNILLDSNFIPKVADFGLAKLYPRGNSFGPFSVVHGRGTVGYIAPEQINRGFGVISSKSDVYSFGMLLLEMAGGRRNADPNAHNSSQAYYPSWVYGRLIEQPASGSEISSVAAEMHELEKKLCIVGLWCIQMKSDDRPTMSEVIEMMEGGVDNLQMPSRPFFCDDEHIHVDDSYNFSSELTAILEDDDDE